MTNWNEMLYQFTVLETSAVSQHNYPSHYTCFDNSVFFGVMSHNLHVYVVVYTNSSACAWIAGN